MASKRKVTAIVAEIKRTGHVPSGVRYNPHATPQVTFTTPPTPEQPQEPEPEPELEGQQEAAGEDVV